MKIKALISFAGVVSMTINEVRVVSDEVGKDLVGAGLAEVVEEETPKKTVKKTTRKTTKKTAK